MVWLPGLGDNGGHRGISSLSVGLPGWSHLLEQVLKYDCENSQSLESPKPTEKNLLRTGEGRPRKDSSAHLWGVWES